MFGLRQKQKPYAKETKGIYAEALNEVRRPFFYTDLGLSDTQDTRFDLLLLLNYLVIERCFEIESQDPEALDAKTCNQQLFDTLFIDMEQGLREIGIGDMGIPKRMKKMMLAFNGRMHKYKEAFAQKEESNKTILLEETVLRNIFSTEPEAASEKDIKNALALIKYIDKQRTHLKTMDFTALTRQSPLFTGA